jgi:hypothetical protein
MVKSSNAKETAIYGFKKSKQTQRPRINIADRCTIHKFGSHTNAECNAQKSSGNNTSGPKARLPSANIATVDQPAPPEDTPESAMSLIENAYVIVHNPTIDYYSFAGEFIADSGASIHLVNDYNMLIDPIECEPKLINTAKSDTRVKVNIKGSVQVMALNNCDQRVYIDLPNVFYCPDLAANLLSIKQIINSGANVRFENNTMIIEFKNEDVHIKSVTRGNDLWTVSVVKPPPSYFAGLCTNIWHARFGHPSTGAHRLYPVDGDKLPNGSNICEHCVKGKIQRSPFKSSLPISSRPLYRIYSDILGPMPVPTKSGFRYILTFINCHTRYNKIYLLKKKSDTLSCFKEYVSTVENLMSSSQHRVTTLHTDRGGEYNSNSFHTFLKSKGIKVEQAPANTPQQNGVAEQFNKTLLQKIIAIMSAGKLPKWLWGEIAMASSLLINIAPSASIKSDTPHRLWSSYSDPTGSHHTFDYSFLRTIGCRAYTQIKKEHTDKISPKANDFILIKLGTITFLRVTDY